MKDKVLKVISDNSVPENFCEYGEGIFTDTNAVDSMAEEIVKLFSIPVVSNSTWTVQEIRDELESIDETKAAKYFFDKYGC